MGLVTAAAPPDSVIVKVYVPLPEPEAVAAMMRRAGFSEVRFQRRFDGLAVLYSGVKPGPPRDGREPGRSGS